MNKKLLKLKKQLNKKDILQQKNKYDEVKLGMANTSNEFSVANLLETIEDHHSTDKLKRHFNRIETKAKIVQEPESKKEREQQDRKVAAIVMKQNVKKWLPIIKKNRESDKIDFTKIRNIPTTRVNTNASLKHNPIAQELEGELKKNKLQNEDQVKQREVERYSNPLVQENVLQQQKHLSHKVVIKQFYPKKTSLAFFQELKHKRISKIKSKIYHRLRKQKSDKLKLKLMSQLTPIERKREIEKMKEQRAKVQSYIINTQLKERVTLRHATKNKFTQNLMRFGGDKQSLQAQQNYLNQLRSQLLKKVEGQQFDDEGFLENVEDDEDFKTQAIAQLEKDLMQLNEQENNQSGLGLKFLERQRKDDISSSKNQLLELIEFLKTGNLIQEDDKVDQEEKEDDKLSWEDPESQQEQNVEKVVEDDNFVGRSKFKKQIEEDFQIDQENKVSKKKHSKAEKIVQDFLNDQEDGQENVVSERKQKKILKKKEEQKKLEELKQDMQEQDESLKLIEGLSLKKLKRRYQYTSKSKLTSTEIQNLKQTNDELLKQNLSNFNLHFDDDENEQTFIKEKIKDAADDIPNEDKPLKGWGSWAGYGTKQKKPPSAEQMLQQKIKKIQDISRSRKDYKIDNVIMNEKRNSQFSQYLVKELPFEFQTTEQFNYTHTQPLGPEWNSYVGFTNLIQPKVVTKAGKIINAINAPHQKEKVTE